MKPKTLALARLLTAFSGLAGASEATAALAPSQFAGHPLHVLCNRSMETFLPALTVEFERTHPDVDFVLDMAVRFPFDRSAIGDDVAEIYDDMTNDSFVRKYGSQPLTVKISEGGRHTPGKLEALGVLVNPRNPLASVSMDQLEQIYAKTPRGGRPRIVRWGQLGLTGEWEQRPIVVYGVNRYGGAPGGIFNYRVLGTGEPCDESREFMHSPPMIGAISHEIGAIGYLAMCYVDPTVKALSVSPRGSTVPVAPTEENDQAGRYPLSIPFYLCVNRPPGKRLDPYVRDFIALFLSPSGQAIISERGFLPLTPAAARHEAEKLN